MPIQGVCIVIGTGIAIGFAGQFVITVMNHADATCDGSEGFPMRLDFPGWKR